MSEWFADYGPWCDYGLGANDVEGVTFDPVSLRARAAQRDKHRVRKVEGEINWRDLNCLIAEWSRTFDTGGEL